MLVVKLMYIIAVLDKSRSVSDVRYVGCVLTDFPLKLNNKFVNNRKYYIFSGEQMD